MASMPGFLTEWPWSPIGDFKYLLLAPFAVDSTYLMFAGGSSASSLLGLGKWGADLGYFLIAPLLISRMIHNQIWISYSRYRTSKGKNLIIDKSIDFEQVDRERNWDDQIILTGILFYTFYWVLDSAKHLPLWKTDGIILTALLHTGPVEFIYYWLHRALHHHYLYSRYHSHHHSSIVTEPITAVIHPFAEHIAYFILFSIPLAWTVVNGTASIISLFLYLTYIDFMNSMGHCNFEHIPKWIFSSFPIIKYFMYTPSYHSLHHTQFRTNYSLFMPIYDYVYGTMDKSTDQLYEKSLIRPDDEPKVVYLTHFTTLQSLYQMRIGFAGLASRPLTSNWYLWPFTFLSLLITWVYGNTSFVLDKNTFEDKMNIQSWAIPRFIIHYSVKWQKLEIDNMIEQAILEADQKNVKVITLGLLNQGEQLNQNGEVYIQKYPNLKLKLVDGSSLAVAVILNTIPQGTTQVVLRGNLSKVAYSVAYALCEKGVQLTTLTPKEYEKLKIGLTSDYRHNLVLAKTASHKIWLVGEGFQQDQHQSMPPKGALFIPFSPLPPQNIRKDCFYHNTPAMVTPSSLANQHACENWLPRRTMSAWRIAGILHALEGWNVHECGNTMFSVDKLWQAALHHGFRPLPQN